MQFEDIKENVNHLWDQTAITWQDDVSKRYKSAVIDEITELLVSMQKNCIQLKMSSDEALKRLKDIQQ